jgi:O-antigen/teichoic acid export membrane protein
LADPPTTQTPAADVIHSEARILGVLSQFGIMQAVLALTGMIRNKVVALRLGPEGFGEYAQIAAIVSLIVTVASFGMGVSLSRNAAKAKTHAERQKQVSNANAIVLLLAGVAGLGAATLLVSGHLLRLAGLAQTTAAMLATAIFLVAIPFEVLKNNYLALLQGILDVRGVAAYRSIGVLLATALTVPVVWFFGFAGAGAQFLLISAVLTVLLGARCRQLGYSPLGVRLDTAIVWNLVTFGIVSLGSSFASVFADTAVRSSLIANSGAAANGLLQAPYVLSNTLKEMVTASVSIIALATIAPRDDRAEIAAAVDKLLGVVIPVGASAIGLLGLLGAPVLSVLYSREFVGGAALFRFILVADLLLVFVWVIGANLLARGARILWLSLDLCFAAARWGVAVLLMPRLGATAVVVGYLAAVVLHLALNLAVFRLGYRIPLSPRHLVRLAVGVVLVASLSVVGQGMPSSVPLYAAALAVWVGYTVHYARRTGILTALRARFRANAG